MSLETGFVLCRFLNVNEPKQLNETSAKNFYMLWFTFQIINLSLLVKCSISSPYSLLYFCVIRQQYPINFSQASLVISSQNLGNVKLSCFKSSASAPIALRNIFMLLISLRNGLYKKCSSKDTII